MKNKVIVLASVLLSIFLTFLSFSFVQGNPDPGPPSIIISKTVISDKVLPDGIARITLSVKGDGDPQQRFSPVDVIHLIDTSGSMSWFGDVVGQNSGSLAADWVKIYEFNPDNGMSDFDVLLDTGSADHSQYIRIKSPSDKWYGYQKNNPSCIDYSHLQYTGVDYLKVNASCAEAGVWEAWAKGETGRQYNLVIGKLPVRLQAAKDAAKHFVSLMKDQDQIGLVSFSSNASAKQPLILLNGQANRNTINSKIDSLSASGATAIGKGIEKAVAYLSQSNGGRLNITKTIILLSDGKETENSNPLGEAQKAKDAGIKIYTIGLGQADENLLSQIATLTSGRYFKADSSSGLQAIYDEIAQSLSNLAASALQITDILPNYVEYAGNATEAPASIVNNADGTTKLSWGPMTIEIRQEKIISFDVRVHKNSGRHLINQYPDSKVAYADYQGTSQTKSFPETYIQILTQTNLSLSVVSQPQGQVAPGNEIIYTIAYGNLGNASSTFDLVANWSFGSDSVATLISASTTKAYGNIAPQIGEINKTITWKNIALPGQITNKTVSFKLKSDPSHASAGTFTIKNIVSLMVDGQIIDSVQVENSVAYGSQPPPPSPPPPSAPGTGGGGGGILSLVVFNEQAANVTQISADLSWFSSLAASCRLVYGPDPPQSNVGHNFGYQFSVVEASSSSTTFHSLNLTGLNANTTYFWRAACHRVNEQIEVLGQAQILKTKVNPIIFAPNPPDDLGLAAKPVIKKTFKSPILGTTTLSVATTSPGSEIATSSPDEEENIFVEKGPGLFANIALFFGRFFNQCSFWIILLLLIIFLLILLNLLKGRKHQENKESKN